MTIGTLKRLRMNLTGDGRATRADVRVLTKEQERSIFLKNCYYEPQIHWMPEMLHASVFNMQINASSNAAKILQRLPGKMGFPVRDDGKIGPLTQDASRRAAKAARDHLADAYEIERRNYYYALADRRPASRKYAPSRWGQGRLNNARRGVHRAAIPRERRRAPREGRGVGVIGNILGVPFGGNRNVVRETIEAFCPNAEVEAVRNAAREAAALTQFAAEFGHPRKGWLDRFIVGLNRLPRPMLALGTIGLFVTALTDPIWLAARMQSIALVPDPLWWLMGAIVTFCFGARDQTKAHDFQTGLADTLARTPDMMRHIRDLEALRPDDEEDMLLPARHKPAVKRNHDDAPNAALDKWRRLGGEVICSSNWLPSAGPECCWSSSFSGTTCRRIRRHGRHWTKTRWF